MPGTPAWRATPHGRRSISEVAAAADVSPRLVLLVGAGVDQSLNGRPGWAALLDNVATAGGVRVDNSLLESVSARWPMESAEALRITLGPAGYTAGIRKAVPPIAGEAAAQTPLAQAITRMVLGGVRLIISLNYTDDLINVLRTNLPTEYVVRVIDRTELSAWQLGNLFQPPENQVNILRLHGSIPFADGVVGEPVVLSRSTYDAVLSSESPYRTILSRLFEDFVVLSIGVSWTDVALRDAAAHARRQLPVARSMHYAALQQTGTTQDWWEQRALTASYGIRPLYYGQHSEVPELLASITDLAVGNRTPPAGAQLGVLAEWLDRVGDYESRQQSVWFAREVDGVANWHTTAEAILAACREDVLDPDLWLACARIEGHLRHFLWFWLPPARRSETRRTLWAEIGRQWTALPPDVRQDLWDEQQLMAALSWEGDSPDLDRRALLQFAFGAHEVMGRRTGNPVVGEWSKRLSHLARTGTGTISARRAALAKRIWSEKPTRELLAETQEAYWEGMEAKVALDLAEIAIKSEVVNQQGAPLRDWPDRLRTTLFGQCDHVRELARVVGSTRREVGAIVLGSFFVPADQAESYLIAAYRRLTDMSGGKPEPTATWAVIVGLIAAYADQARGMQDRDLLPNLCEWLLDKCGTIPLDASLVGVVEQNYAVYWRTFHPRAARLATRVAKQLHATR